MVIRIMECGIPEFIESGVLSQPVHQT